MEEQPPKVDDRHRARREDQERPRSYCRRTRNARFRPRRRRQQCRLCRGLSRRRNRDCQRQTERGRRGRRLQQLFQPAQRLFERGRSGGRSERNRVEPSTSPPRFLWDTLGEMRMSSTAQKRKVSKVMHEYKEEISRAGPAAR
jgi:hypothetical protein